MCRKLDKKIEGVHGSLRIKDLERSNFKNIRRLEVLEWLLSIEDLESIGFVN